MSNFESIDEALDCESTIVKPEKAPVVRKENTATEIDSQDARKDYDYTRANLYSLIEKGQEAVNGALELAQESDSARSYEVAGALIKNIADVTDKLLDLQKKAKDLEQVNITNNQTNVTNNSVFVGSTTDLQKMIKEGMINSLSD